MTTFEMWVKNCAEKNDYLYRLEEQNGVELYLLRTIDNPKYDSYNHYHTTYHVWDRKRSKWVFTSTDYKTAYEKFKHYKEEKQLCMTQS